VIRRWLPAAAWFLLVFVLSLAWLFPVEPLVRARLQEMEQQSGVAVRWESASWALWRSTLRGVTVTAPDGRVLAKLDELVLMPRPSGSHLQGTASWGSVTADLGNAGATFVVQGLPVDVGEEARMKDLKLNAEGRWEARPGRLELTSYELSGQAEQDHYKGPLRATGKGRFQGRSGQVEIASLEGDNLRGRGTVNVLLPQGPMGPRINGRLEVELGGNPFNLTVQGQPGAWSVDAAPGTPTRGQ